MTSQGPGLEIIGKLAEWSTEEIENNLDQVLQELLSHLRVEDKGQVLQAVYALLVTCLPCLPVEKADESVLHLALPAAQLLFEESLEGIKLRLDEKAQLEFDAIADTLSSLLQVCIELLKCMEYVLEYVMSQGNVSISSIPNVPKTVAFLLLQTFKHCKESDALYGDLFVSIADVLGAVFRQCHQVHSRYFTVITSNIKFDSSVETDIVHLVDVLQILSEIGEHVTGLDIKTMAEQWKGYTKIIHMYLEPLRGRLKISYPLTYLSVEITNNLEQLTCQESFKDPKSVPRVLKTTSFILKIVVKLSEQFGGGSGCLNDCHRVLYELMLTLHRYSPPLLLMQNLESNLIDEIERHLTVAADPLLSHLICENDFREEFFRRCRKLAGVQNDCLPHLLLILSVLKRLLTLDAEVRDYWTGGSKEGNIVGSILELLKFCHLELNREISLPSARKLGGTPARCDLYEALCCHCAALILTFNNEQFQRVESLLMDSLVAPSFWPALFSGDVWCICARAGSSELVLDQVLYFADIVSAFQPSHLSERAECKVITLFLQRMSSFLSTKGKQTLIDKFPPSEHPLMWHVFGLGSLSKEMWSTVFHSLICSSSHSIQNFLKSNYAVMEFNKMILCLFGLQAAIESTPRNRLSSDIQQYSIVSEILSVWQYACQGDLVEHLNSPDHFLGGSKWLQRLLAILCKCTEHLVYAMSNKEILQILNLLDGVISRCNSFSLKFSVIQIIRGLATKTLEPSPDQQFVCSKISKLFSCLLEEKNPLVKETALETFEYFAHFTAHESIVADAVADSEAIQVLVTSYLQKNPPAFDSDAEPLNHHEYLAFQAKLCCNHKCEMKKLRIPSPKSPEKPAKKLRLEFDESTDLSAFLADDLLSDLVDKDFSEAVSAISRIVKDSEFLISQFSFSSLPLPSRADLQRTVEEMNKFTKL